jgi:hypothetical protein
MQASVVRNSVMLQSTAIIEGTLCLVVDCADFDAYKDLPAALSYNEVVCGKTGWNSDKNVAYFQSNRSIAYVSKGA